MVLLDVLIVGGGLSGIALAQRLSSSLAQKQSTFQWKLLEARRVLGGRLVNDAEGRHIDLGGAWIWPDFQPQISSLVTALKLETFPQPDDPSSTRIAGGAVRLIETLAAQVPNEHIQLQSPVVSCTWKKQHDNNNNGTQEGASCSAEDYIEIQTANQQVYHAKRVVFCVPPRLLAKHITFDPPLNTQKWHAMTQCHTWMAGVTKIGLEYSTRFWDLSASNMGLPTSTGPAFQVYDSSTITQSQPPEIKTAALTFFALVPPHSPAYSNDDLLAQQVAQQMATVWKALKQPKAASDQATNYTRYYIQRWPQDPYISEDDKPTRIHPHPHPIPALATNDWEGRLLFAGSEADLKSPGVMEGAIGAAERVWKELSSSFDL